MLALRDWFDWKSETNKKANESFCSLLLLYLSLQPQSMILGYLKEQLFGSLPKVGNSTSPDLNQDQRYGNRGQSQSQLQSQAKASLKFAFKWVYCRSNLLLDSHAHIPATLYFSQNACRHRSTWSFWRFPNCQQVLCSNHWRKCHRANSRCWSRSRFWWVSEFEKVVLS